MRCFWWAVISRARESLGSKRKMIDRGKGFLPGVRAEVEPADDAALVTHVVYRFPLSITRDPSCLRRQASRTAHGDCLRAPWIPAFAGMTEPGETGPAQRDLV